jgi:hypothetical protein
MVTRGSSLLINSKGKGSPVSMRSFLSLGVRIIITVKGPQKRDCFHFRMNHTQLLGVVSLSFHVPETFSVD